MPAPRASLPTRSVATSCPAARAASRNGPSPGVVTVTCQPGRRASSRSSPISAPPGRSTAQTARTGVTARAGYGGAHMPHADLLAGVGGGVPEDAGPERFAARRDWLLARVPPGARVLDLGCGAGEFAAVLAEHGARPVALDAAPEAVRRARARGVDAREVAPDSAISQSDAVFDIAWLGETLEHLVDPVGTLHEVRRVLRPRGHLLATTPDHPPELVRTLADDPQAFAEHFSPRADHLRFFNALSLRALLDDLGFQDVALQAEGGTLFVQARW